MPEEENNPNNEGTPEPAQEPAQDDGKKKEPEEVGGYESKHEVAPDPVGGYNEDGSASQKEKPPVKVDPENPSLNEIDNLDEDRRAALQNFINKNQLSKAAIKSLIGLEKSDMTRRQELYDAETRQQDAEMEAQRKAYADELKRDKQYGGEKFKESLSKVQQLEDMGLTKRIMGIAKKEGVMIHPDIMRDLVDIYDAVKKTDPHGFGGAAPENSDPSMTYYTNRTAGIPNQ